MQVQCLGGFDMNAMKEKMFSKADADKSGGVSLDELKKMSAEGPQASRSGKPEDLFKAADADGNGELSKDELDGVDPMRKVSEQIASAMMQAMMSMGQGGMGPMAQMMGGHGSQSGTGQSDALAILSGAGTSGSTSQDLILKLFEAMDSEGASSSNDKQQNSV